MIRRLLFPLVLALGLSAHIGSPNVVYDGNAGAYPVRVVVRPPSVVPGVADVIVQVAANGVRRVNVRPVFWRTGVGGAPSGDDAVAVEGEKNLYAGKLWLMSRGSYSVYVTVYGAQGSGTAIVPVTSFATGRLQLSRGLAAVLIPLGLLLFAGLVTIVHAASGEALLEPGVLPDARTKRRARIAGFVATPILALLVFGGARWWGSVDGSYERTMYRPPAVHAERRGAQLDLVVRDTAAFHALYAPVIPDHGKMMHLFIVGAGTHDPFGHFHPAELDSLHFRTQLAGVPAGKYRLFGDLVLASGLSLTVTTTIDWAGDPSRTPPADSDDVFVPVSHAVSAHSGASAALNDDLRLLWTTPDAVTAQRPTTLAFEVRDASNALVRLDPYLGMPGHAVVLRDDESVFIHLHPMGTVASVAQQAFAARDRGDTTADGRPRFTAADSSGMMMMPMDGRLSFPYEFPRPGRYRIWVQVKPAVAHRILTAAFDVDVR
jgi:hypothetical protein